MSEEAKQYANGYNAGRKRADIDLEEIKQLREENAKLKRAQDKQRERIYMQSLEIALKHCNGWSIGGEKIKDAKDYCAVAKVFANNSISILERK